MNAEENGTDAWKMKADESFIGWLSECSPGYTSEICNENESTFLLFLSLPNENTLTKPVEWGGVDIRS